MRKVIFILAIALATLNLSAQNNDNPRYGLFGHYIYNMHTVDFTTLPGINTCCIKFSDGTGSGVAIGLLYEYPIYKDLFLGGRIGYFMKNGLLTKERQELVGGDGAPVMGTFETTLDLQLANLVIEPMLSYRLFADLFVHGSFQLGIPVSKTVTHVEKVMTPAIGTYGNNTREWLNQTKDVADIGLAMGVSAGLSYEIALTSNKSWIIAPEIFYDLGLNQVVADTAWKINSLRAGIAIKYQPGGTEKSTLSADIKAVGMDRDSIEKPFANMIVEEFLSSNLKPLLTHVFFSDNSAEIPAKYKRLTKEETNAFQIDKLHKVKIMDIYYQNMNVIGRRLKEYPEAKLKITGCNSNTGAEKNNTELSKKRAEAVRDYFLNTWEIAPDRLIVSERNLPQEPSNEKEADGIEENRRVEISSNTWEVIAPLVTNDTVRVANPPLIRFMPTANSSVGISDWNITAYQQGKLLKAFSGNKLPDKFDWKLDFDDNALPSNNEMLTYKMQVKDKNNQTFETQTKQLPVQQVTIREKRQERTKDKYIDRFSLILFQFDESKLSYYNNIVSQMIQKRIQPDSKISITGHTDRVGEFNHNLELSVTRAKALSSGIKSDNILLYGMGENELLYDNDTPEGRFYCRRVDVVIETPIKE